MMDGEEGGGEGGEGGREGRVASGRGGGGVESSLDAERERERSNTLLFSSATKKGRCCPSWRKVEE